MILKSIAAKLREPSFLRRLSALALLVGMGAFLVAGTPVLGETIQIGDTGLKSTADAAQLPTGTTSVTVLAGRIILVVLQLLGVVFLALTIFAGFKWMMARGEENEVEDAVNLIRDAVIGLVIIFAAYAITNFVIDQVLIVTKP